MNGLGVGLVTSLSESPIPGAKPTVQLDPEGVQARDAEARVTVGCLPALDAVSDVWVTGEVEVENLISVSSVRPAIDWPPADNKCVLQMINVSTEASKTVHATLAQAILEGEQNKNSWMSTAG